MQTRKIIVLIALITLSVIFIHGRTPRAVALEPDRTLNCWRGEARNILLDYIHSVSTPGSSDFIPSKDRVAVFDMDGTIMSEKPFPYVFAATIRYLVRHKDEPALKGPQYKSLCEAAERVDVGYLHKHMEQTFVLPFEGKTYGFFRNWCLNFFETEINSLKNRPQKALIFKPMIQLIDLLHKHGFQVYVVSGSMQFAIMAISEKYLHVDESRCIGSMVHARAEMEGKRMVFVREKLDPPSNVKSGKAIRIMTRTGQAPVLAFGNSSGDIWMLDFTASSPYRHMAFVIDHDDPREFVYHYPALLKMAKEKKWVVISMKESFKTLYGD
ncbi:MAG: haloacid dehalogenase-like hydrolase [Deltaproteobacteria bacterium]|nr:haloacid dehalogenase-like hydrolase [Deltaproteobacteria bacterium]